MHGNVGKCGEMHGRVLMLIGRRTWVRMQDLQVRTDVWVPFFFSAPKSHLHVAVYLLFYLQPLLQVEVTTSMALGSHEIQTYFEIDSLLL